MQRSVKKSRETIARAQAPDDGSQDIAFTLILCLDDSVVEDRLYFRDDSKNRIRAVPLRSKNACRVAGVEAELLGRPRARLGCHRVHRTLTPESCSQTFRPSSL